ncbi:MAG TPA: NosD domain-containing protein [Candidatus Methanoperedens sp.]
MISRKILLIVLVILLNLETASAATLNAGKGQTYTTIQSAIDAANTGDVISVGEGTYTENLVIKKNGISILGANREKTVIDGKKTGSVIRIDQASSVKISGFTIQNSGGSGKEDAGITIYSAQNNMIMNTIFLNNNAGISIYSGSNNNIISGNDIKSTGKNGIFIFSSGENSIYNNNIQDNQFGIYADSARKNRIYSNNFIENKNQAYDNSGQNSWDDGKSGNYWSDFKGSGAYAVPGGAKAADNYPLQKAITIKSETVPTPAEQKTTQGENGKSSPGFSGIAFLALLFSIAVFRNWIKKE